jgi:hypothetical protein
VSNEREDCEVIWMVDLHAIVFLGTFFGSHEERLSQQGRLFEVDLAMFMLVH